MGVGRGLKENNPSIVIVEAQPVKGHYIQGLKNMQEAIIPAIYDESLLGKRIMIDTEEAFEMTRRIIREEGIGVGMSSGAAMLAAKKVADEIDEGFLAVIFPDRCEKYLSTKLFQN
jgi:cysteine synthase B